MPIRVKEANTIAITRVIIESPVILSQFTGMFVLVFFVLVLGTSRWFYPTPPTLIRRLQLTTAQFSYQEWLVGISGGHRTTPFGIIGRNISVCPFY